MTQQANWSQNRARKLKHRKNILANFLIDLPTIAIRPEPYDVICEPLSVPETADAISPLKTGEAAEEYSIPLEVQKHA